MAAMNPLRHISSRRCFLAAVPVSALAAPSGTSIIPSSFPAHPAELAKEMVGVSHGNAARVKELLSIRPALANAAWEWGFGDWETALGAASHVGNREIAELLLSHGAYPTLFSAAMLGQLDVLKAMIAARPGIQRTTGPHGISLLAHAKAGGTQSEDTFRFLRQLGDASGLAAEEISEEELSKFAGDYVFGDGADDRIAITQKGKQLSFQRQGTTARPIHYVGDHSFRPAGASSVRIRFGEDATLTIRDGELVVKASRRRPGL